MKKKEVQTVAVEVLKTAAGAVIGRTAVVYGKKGLKVDQETDPKKKKLKEIGVGAGVAGAGVAGSIYLPDEYKSFAAGFATAGVFGALTPFGKEDKGFIPVLHGTEEEYTEYQELSPADELNSLGAFEEYDDLEKIEDETELNAVIDEDFEEPENLTELNGESLN